MQRKSFVSTLHSAQISLGLPSPHEGILIHKADRFWLIASRLRGRSLQNPSLKNPGQARFGDAESAESELAGCEAMGKETRSRCGVQQAVKSSESGLSRGSVASGHIKYEDVVGRHWVKKYWLGTR
uniref:Uncharacterized protein n=1 Tax=Coccidioides posadasii RMSCC 3488 TaxID=454284 RepID=A0A0J6FB95_COCPO|nr:hypothetical protein CPAG_02544 [Coccidioides posadasii RMSCC 3488]